MSGALLDTSILIGPDIGEEVPASAAISVITLGELRAGVLLARDVSTAAARRDRLEAIRSAFLPIAIDAAIADHYGSVLAVARSQGSISKATDLLIIATAGATDRRLYTCDEAQARLAQAAGVNATAR